MSGVNEIRSSFLQFFARNGHEIVASSSLVPRNDPTLMFTNAGMVQFKNVFTGVERRPYHRATTAQKCVRAGGKHNDLDNVGYTARHHTFFEMLGNFSFGDYFKPLAVELAWTLLTKEFALAKDKLWVTVYHDDDEAFGLWKRIARLPDSRVVRIATSDNFWAMGDTGPCGPCSEIFYDHGDSIPGGPPGSAEAEGDRFIEIWNLVFMQFETLPGGERVALPRPSIDTGMGLERVAAVLQGKHDNYDIDLMRALIRASAEASGVDADGPHKASHRVIADHLRASAFLVADGVLPSNEGRGYVLRRIMRRAMRHAQLIGAREPLMWRLVPALTREMGPAYPELLRAEALITETLKLEETRFRTTLARGLAILEEETSDLEAGAKLAGEVAFKLYDTYGFPLDLTQDALRARGMGVDTDGFASAMERQRAEARKAWAGSGEAATETVWFALRERLGATEFLGYETESAEGVAAALIRDGDEVASLGVGEKGWLILNQTPFYGESGGQVGDVGVIAAAGFRARVLDTKKKLGDLFVHEVEVEEGTLQVGMALELKVDHAARAAIRANHSATHLLHEALRIVLGDHVAQKGSLVSPDRLRFDIAHPKPITAQEIAAVEDIANRVVLANEPVVTRLMGIEEARESGARALFGEKYGDEVRVVSMGVIEGGDNGSRPYSVELCGGTHVARTGDIGLVSIVGESAVAAGVRRIEAKTREEARKRLTEDSRAFSDLAALLRAPASEAAERLEALIEDKKKLERELADARRKLAMGGGASGGADAVREVSGVRFYARQVAGVEMKDLKSLADEAKQSVGSGVVAIVAASEDGKASLVVAVTGDLTGRFNAVDLVRLGSAALGGKGGGGRPDMAQAGGPDGANAAEALAAVEQGIRQKAAE
ncbi:MAG: alanine--tRNA ligase [Roseiarcus sp.]